MARVALWESADRYAPRVLPSPLAPITFPATPLVTKALIALGADPSGDPADWQWLDIGSYIRYRTGVSTSVGRPDESGLVTPGKATLTLDNRDGRFTRRNPLSPYYGLLSRNTPIRLSVDPGDGDHIRFEGFVNEWPTRWDKSGNDTTVPIECAGVLRRLGQGETLKSPLRITYLAAAPLAYWPLEDEGPTTRAASGLPGGKAMRSSPAMDFTTGIPGALRSLNLVSDTFRFGDAPVTLPSTAGVQIEFTTSSDTGLDTGVMNIVGLVDTAGLEVGLIIAIAAALADGTPHHYAARFVQDGADVDETIWRDGNITLSTTLTNTSITTNTGPAPRIGQESSGVVLMSHIAVFSFATMSAPAARSVAIDGYAGEQAHVRMARLCEQEGIQFFTAAGATERLGPQPVGTLVDVLRDAEKADMGVVYERGFGLGYQSRAERYNAAVGLALDFDQGQIAEPPEPADDDQRLRNRWTVSRPQGAGATVEDAASIEADGLYDDAETVNVETDDQLENQASWRLHVGIVDVDRWPEIALQLAASPELIDDWNALGYGPRITAANPPDEVAPDTIDVFAEGHKERWDPFVWSVELAASPASPYNVGVYDLSRYDTAGSETTADFVAGTDTSMTVATTLGPIWIQGAVDFNIKCGGVVLQVTNISGASSPQTFTITQTPVNGVVKTIPAGSSVSLADPSFYAL